jgi:phosphate transport system protein
MTREHYDALLRQLDDEVLEMGELVAETIGQCIDALQTLDADRAQKLIAADGRIDGERYDVENRSLLLIATQQPLAGDLRTVAAVLTIATELERIGDYCEGIAELTLRIAADRPAGLKPPVPGSLKDIKAMASITQQLLRQSLQAYKDRDIEAAGAVWSQDDEVDALYEEVFRKLLAEMTANKANIRRGTYLLWVAHNVERMADRVTNIAERIAFIVTGDVAAFRDRLRSETVPG